MARVVALSSKMVGSIGMSNAADFVAACAFFPSAG